jgi:VWFA-related protein
MSRVLWAFAAVTVAIAPQQEQRPVFRSETTLVPVTVTVTDQQGRPVTGLTKSDFTVFENGRPREIVTFYPQMLTPGPAVEPSMAIARARETGITPSTRRTFVIVLGFGRIQGPTKAFDGAIKFVREHLLPQDVVSVMLLHRATALTTDHRALEDLLVRYKKEHERIVGDINAFIRGTRFPGVCGGPPIPAEMLAGFDRDLFTGILPPTSIRSTIDLLLGMGVGAPTGEKPWQQQQTFRDLLRDLEKSCANLIDVVVLSDRIKLFAAIEYLRYVDGDKHVVVLGGPYGIAPNADVAKVIAARANDARVTVDVVSTRGTGSAGRSGGRFVISGCDACRDVAERTGGSYTSLDYMDKALAKIDGRTRSSYLLGYTPVNTTLDGTYRQVRVEVNRPKVTVSHRYGYFASEEPAPLDVKDLVAGSRGDAAVALGADATDFSISAVVTLPTATPTTAAPAEVSVDITVDLSVIPLEMVGGFRTGELDVSLYSGDAKQKVIGQAQERWALRADAPTYAAWLAKGLTRTMKVPVSAVPKYVKVVVYDRQTDRVASKTITIGRQP